MYKFFSVKYTYKMVAQLNDACNKKSQDGITHEGRP